MNDNDIIRFLLSFEKKSILQVNMLFTDTIFFSRINAGPRLRQTSYKRRVKTSNF